MKFTFHPPSPLVNEETNKRFADAFIELLETVARTEMPATPFTDPSALANRHRSIPRISAKLVAAILFLAAVSVFMPMAYV